tara:strand:+ start:145 stop:978 length:834 start_codon:yes stop_codon:yes gene_type:complete
MKNFKMFCISLEPNHYEFIKKLGYEPVGLGDKNFNKNWYQDKLGENISKKNKNYGEYTYHYWIWKNYLDEIKEEWIGFCQYRKFWSLKNHRMEEINFNSLNSQVLKNIPEKFNEYETILGEPILINQFRTMKFIKKGLKFFLKRPMSILNKKKRNINFHFDFMHGENNLEQAINLLDKDNQEDFRKFVNTEVSFNPHNMFICRSKQKLTQYYETLFPWLTKCEKLFGFENLKGFGKIRIYGFLAERFMPYWFRKNTKSTTMPIIFYDIRKDLNQNRS